MDSAPTGRYPAPRQNGTKCRAGSTGQGGILQLFSGVVLSLGALLFLGACTGNEVERPPDPQRQVSPSGRVSATPSGGDGPSGSPGEPPSSGDQGSGADSGTGAEINDRKNRRTVSGHAPRYVEIASAGLRTRGDDLEMTLVFRGPVPSQLGGRALLRTNFTLLTKPGRRYSFGAQASKDGWEPFATGKDSVLPRLQLGSSRVTLLAGWDQLGGVQPLRWSADVSWVSGTNNAFDIVPESGYAAFP